MIDGNYGFTDEAAEIDQFRITDYIGGLARFIESCNTPMTISIQGSWGTGKTSLMNLVKNELSENIIPVWFNTWEFSQFNMDDQLAVSLLSNLISEFDIKDEEIVDKTNKLIKGLRLAVGVGKDLALAYIDAKVGGKASEMVDTVSKEAIAKAVEGANKTNDFIDPTMAIKELRKQFALCVEKAVGKTSEGNPAKRIVIFIDDLDRLEPRKAVELLEVLKNFLDCKNCVFVLAIDYEVVVRGVAKKYGSLSDDEKESAEKGRSFFDKIIQVPFKMPVARYDITGYVKNCFKQIGLYLDEDELIKYVDLIQYSIGTNPRAMKRLFNSFQLLTIVVPDDLLKAAKNQQLLFAILCLQHCNENIYNFMIRHSNELKVDIFNSIVDGIFENLENLKDVEDLSEDDILSAKPFMEKFRNAVDSDRNGGISEEELDNFLQVLDFSAITSAADTEPVKRRGSSIVDSFDDLDMGTFTTDDMRSMVNTIMSFGDDICYQLVKAKASHIAFRIGSDQGPVFADAYERKNGYNLDCFVPRPEIYTDKDHYPEIVEWIDHSKYKPGKAAGGRRVSPAAYTDEEKDSLMGFAKLVYDSWKDESE